MHTTCATVGFRQRYIRAANVPLRVDCTVWNSLLNVRNDSFYIRVRVHARARIYASVYTIYEINDEMRVDRCGPRVTYLPTYRSEYPDVIVGNNDSLVLRLARYVSKKRAPIIRVSPHSTCVSSNRRMSA